VQMKGGELRRLALRIEECPGSVVVEYGRR
jgi:hypothetical protein